MIKFIKYTVLAVSILAMTLTTLNITSILPVETVLTAQAQTTPTPLPAPIERTLMLMKTVLGEVKVSSTEPRKLKSDESLVVLSAKQSPFKRVYRFVVLTSEQMKKLYPLLAEEGSPLFVGETDSTTQSKISISIKCEGSYPPLKIKCTIEIAW